MGELIQQIRQIWERMDLRKRLLFGGGMLLLLIFFVFLFQRSQPQYELLYGNLSQMEQDEIIGKLHEMGVAYRKDYNALYVPNASMIRAQLMKDGIPKGGIVGLEIFDRSSLGATNFQNVVNYQRALQGELRRTLREIEGIIDAQVILDLPDQESVFEDEKKNPTAAITLTLRAPNALSLQQVKAIVNFVVSSVVGMQAENVTIIDNFANELTAALRNENSLLGGETVKDRLQVRMAFEKDLEQSIESMLGRVFGHQKVVARVNAELNLDYQEIKKETFGDRGVPRSEQEISESYTGTGRSPYGIPGTDSNITEYRLLGEEGESAYEKDERTVNYEINRIEEYLVKAPGKVERLTVSVFIDDNLSEALKLQIEDSIATAVGLDRSRGDQISVVSLKFAREEPSEPTPEPSANLFPYLIIIFVLLVAAVFLAWRSRQARLEPEEGIDLLVGEGEEEIAAVEELSPEEQRRRERQKYLEDLANEHPEDVAILLKTWLLEE